MNDDAFDDLLRDAARSYREPPPTPRDHMWANIERARAADAARTHVLPRAGTRWLRTAAGMAAVLLAGIAIGRGTGGPARLASSTSPMPPSAAAVQSPPAVVAASREAPSADATRRLAVAEEGAETGRPLRSLAGPGSGGVLAVTVANLGQPRDARATDGRTYGIPRNTPGLIGEGSEMNAYRLTVLDHLARTELLLTGFRARSSSGAVATRADVQQFAALTRDLLQNTRLLLATRASDDAGMTRLLEDLELVLMQISQYASEGGARRGDLDAINHSLDRRNVLPKLRSTIPAGAPAPAGT